LSKNPNFSRITNSNKSGMTIAMRTTTLDWRREANIFYLDSFNVNRAYLFQTCQKFI
jgi:hypothetical protein